MTSALTVFAAAPDRGEPFGIPPIGELFNFPGIDLGIDGPLPSILTRTTPLLLLASLVSIAFMVTAFAKPQIVPSKLQAIGEAVVEFVRKIAVDIIGEEGNKYVVFLTSLFVFIFFANLFKITPFLMFPTTGRIAVPLVLALMVWFVYIGAGIKTQGFFGYFKGIAFPPGVPWPIYFILTPIEILSNLILRPFTLAIRLFANMVAGHILIVVTLITMWLFLDLRAELPIGIVVTLLSPLVFGFELFVIALQAYIFVILSSVYISSSLHPHH